MESESFIDKLGRLTASEAEVVATEAQREQDGFIASEVVRLDRARKEEAETKLARSTRSETRSMAWAAAELLKNSNVPLEPWINEWPQYEKKKGLFRSKEVFVRQLGSVAFESWRLHDMESSQDKGSLPIEIIVSNVHPYSELETRETRVKPIEQLLGLVLTSEGHVGFVRKTTTLSDAINGRVKRSLSNITQSRMLTERIKGLVDDPRYGVVTYDLLALDIDGSDNADNEFAKLYADIDTRERQLRARMNAAKQAVGARNRDHRHARSFMESMLEIYKTRTQPEDIDVDESIRQSIARLLATNDISLK